MNGICQLSLPKLRTTSNLQRPQEQQLHDHTEPGMAKHSRDSSIASSASSPITPSFARGHTRWPSSSSSLVLNPDSPVLSSKPKLHDLVEDPAERDDVSSFDLWDAPIPEPVCICDSPFCEHRAAMQQANLPSSPEWSLNDDYFGEAACGIERSTKRRRSGEISLDNLAANLSSRLSRRFPSISRKWQSHRASLSESTVRSAPLSRSSSFKQPSSRRSTMTRSPIEPPSVTEYPNLALEPEERGRALRRASANVPGRGLHVRIPTPDPHPEDCLEPISTPLLPPMMDRQFNNSAEEVQSPLQSPTVAQWTLSDPVTDPHTSVVYPPGMPTPPLSAKNSITSIAHAHSTRRASDIIPPLLLASDASASVADDPWADKLGHANFQIQPAPYLPSHCDAQACNRLLEDWEAARKQYMRHAAAISSHHGPTSQTYHFAQAKWAQIDARWRAAHERANEQAAARGEGPLLFQSLAPTQAVPTALPSALLSSSSSPTSAGGGDCSSASLATAAAAGEPCGKFPAVAEHEMVGPMVKYAKPQRGHKMSSRSSSANSILRIFTDPGSLLSGLRR